MCIDDDDGDDHHHEEEKKMLPPPITPNFSSDAIERELKSGGGYYAYSSYDLRAFLNRPEMRASRNNIMSAWYKCYVADLARGTVTTSHREHYTVYRRKKDIVELIRNIYLMYTFANKLNPKCYDMGYADEDKEYTSVCYRCGEPTLYSSIMLVDARYRNTCLDTDCVMDYLDAIIKEWYDEYDNDANNDGVSPVMEVDADEEDNNDDDDDDEGKK